MKNIKQIQQQSISPVSAACINTSCDTQLKLKFLTKAERSMFSLTADLKAILVGLLLGDLHARKQDRNVNAWLCFEQGLVHEEYVMHLYELFKSYCRSVPKTTNRLPDKRTGKIYSRVTFTTMALPCFNELYELFYVNGKKVIPSNIGELLKIGGLAYWICDDGCFVERDQVIYLGTDSFALAEVELLVSVLTDKFNLKCTINKHGNGFRIRISQKSLPIIQALLAPPMPSMMRFKIGL
jgi:hypothetical protein